MVKSHEMLNTAQRYADAHSTCVKVKVGAALETTDKSHMTLMGCNHGVHNCKSNGCRRIALYGNASKEHRLPSDCDALHSEIDVISKAAKYGCSTQGATLWVTRYPCEACARAIKAAGIETVIYGRKESVSDYSRDILAGVELIHADDWDWEDNNE